MGMMFSKNIWRLPSRNRDVKPVRLAGAVTLENYTD
jgi:hypothetical protein